MTASTAPSRVVLASRSPRRLELLRRIGLTPSVRPADVDESPAPDESPVEMALRLACRKARVASNDPDASPDELVIAADTIVVHDSVVMGKPADTESARQMLRALAGATHQVMTGVCLRWAGSEASDVVVTDVRFLPLSDADISWYVATHDCTDKAGGYGIQDGAGAFVDGISGSPDNVMGLPLATVVQLARRLGVQLMG